MTPKGKRPAGRPDAQADTPTLASLAEEKQIDFEVRFLGDVLRGYPEYVDALRIMSNNLTQLRRYQEGLELDKRLVRLRPNDPVAHYNLACSYALLRRTDLAVAALRQAIELGYRDFPFMRQDKDLDSIRKDPRFQQLLLEYEAS